MEINNKKLNIVGGISVALAVGITAFITWALYQHTVNLLTENLRGRLEAIVLTAAVQFETDDLEALQIEKDWEKPEWSKVVNQLYEIRNNNLDILFAYIIRKNKNDPSQMEFVADSHSINPYAKIDLNNDGAIDDADLLQWPGQPYAEPPEEAFLAYEDPITSKELIQDQWGVEIVGYAPIKNKTGETVAVVAVDMKADDFNRITRSTFYPFLVFILGLMLILLILAYVIIFFWNKRLLLLAEIDRQKDELLGIVSHQLAAPVTALKWYLELLLDGDIGKLTADQRSQVFTMKTVTANLSDLVSMILDVSRIQLGRMRVEKQKVDFSSFIKDILKVITPKAEEKKQKIIKSIPRNLPQTNFDKRLTRMVIENILTNAVKYTPEDGKIIFGVSVESDSLLLEITDNGLGIPKEDQPEIFNKLFRAKNVRDKIEGNGFGLYIARGAIENQGGQIWFRSEEGRGTSFFIRLPLK